MGGYFSLKKVLSIILILTILIIPFQTLLNVKAEVTAITTDETTLEGNTDFKYVTNNTATLEVSSDNESIESFSAFKILDVYYNDKTNEMTYGFTGDFKDFIDRLPEGDEFYNLTIEKYQGLTSDTSSGAWASITTTSSLNRLVSKYATYLNGKNGKENLDSFIEITKQADGIYTKEEIVVGSYLVLPTEVVSKIENDDSYIRLLTYTYGVSVANVNFQSSNGYWSLDDCYKVYRKYNNSSLVTTLFNASFDELMQNMELLVDNVVYSSAKELYFGIGTDLGLQIPTNTHSSIKENITVMNKIDQKEIIFPKGLTYDLNEIYSSYQDDNDEFVNYKTTIKDNSIYGVAADGVTEIKLSDFIENKDTNSLVLLNIENKELYFKLKTNDYTNLGTSTDASKLNTITTNAYYLKDAYVDISGMSQEEAEAKVLGVGTLTNTVYTYGVQVTNKEKNTLLELNGAKFQIYADEGCTEKVGEEFEITENGTYTFKGLNDTDTYYLKQTKAPTGYKLLTGSTELNPTSLNKEAGYYLLEVANEKMGLLPTTGGLGTILYTTFGLLIIVIGSIIFIRYRKRQTNN